MAQVSVTHERFTRLTAELAHSEWVWLAAVAAEERLGPSTLVAVTRAASESGTVRESLLDAWLARSRASGLLVNAGLAPALTPRHALGGREQTFALPPELRQWTLRRAQEQGLLEPVVRACQTALGGRSRARLALLIQSGDRAGLERWLAQPPPSPLASGTSDSDHAARSIREALLAPFDAVWFTRTFANDALPMAHWALGSALAGLEACGELYEFTSAALLKSRATTGRAPKFRLDPGDAEELAAVLCQHALLRGDAARLDQYLELLPTTPKAAFRAAAAYQRGELSSALELIENGLASRGRRTLALPLRVAAQGDAANAPGTLSSANAALPLLALLTFATETEAGRATAKRLIQARGTGEDASGAARAFRTLLRYAAEPDALHARIDAYQVSASASAWEVLLLGLTVQLYLDQELTRGSWCRLLVQRGLGWQARGYDWFGRQALFIAQALAPQAFPEELARERPGAPLPECKSRELLLRDLVTPKSDWEKALDALSLVSEKAEAEVERAERLAFIVDVVHCELRRPLLQEFRPEQGWSSGRRIALQEAYERRAELPAEDVRVLRCTSENSDHKRDFLPEAWEALIGHPRVINGARGEEPVEVAPGHCRVTALESNGYLEIAVEPEHAELGVNVRAEGERRLLVYRVTAAMHKVVTLLPHGLRVPKHEEQRALAVLSKLSQAVEVHSPLLGEERSLVSNSTPCLRISPHAGAWLVQAGVRPFGARGQFFIAGSGRRTYTAHSEGQKLRTERDFDEERVQLSLLLAECPTLLFGILDDEEPRSPNEPRENWVLGHEGVLGLLAELRDVSAAFEIEWPESAPLRVRGRLGAKNLQGLLRREKGWYLATGGLRLDEVTELSLAELATLPTIAGGRFVQLPSGDFVEIEARIRRVMAALSVALPSGRGSSELRLHESSLHTLELLAESGSGFDLDEAGKGWLERVASVRARTFEVPAELRADLRPYQVEGFRFLARLRELSLGACLADDMGLGKTVQILAALLVGQSDGPMLVVAPTSVCSNWINEAARFAPSLRAFDYSGPERARLLAEITAENGASPPLLVASYTILQQDIEGLSEVEWGTVVLDEAQFIKNPASQRALAAFRLKAKHRIASTGTPVENHLGDLWSIFHFLNPALLGPFRAFDRRFAKPIERSGDRETQAELHRHVQPFILRRLKSEVLTDLPPITTVRHEVRLNEAETMRYALLRRQIHDKLRTPHGKRQYKLEILAEIMRLRRFCCHPRLVFKDADYEGSKVEVFLQLVRELVESEHRALVFSQFTDFLGMVRERLDEQGIAYHYLDGSTPKAERQARVEAFQTGTAPLFLISLKAGGFGLNLTAADYVIHLDPWWNPAVEAQATDRAHRIGQERPVTVYRLITKDTIEESIVELHQQKRRLADALLASDANGARSPDFDPLELLGLIDPG